MRSESVYITIIVALNVIIYLASVIWSRSRGWDLVDSITAGFGHLLLLWAIVAGICEIGALVVKAVKWPQRTKKDALGALVAFCFFLVFVIAGVALTIALEWTPWLFLGLWVFIPCVSWIVSRESISCRLPAKGLRALRPIFIGGLFLMTLVLWVRWNKVRDTFGNAYVQGYSAYYYDESDPDTDRAPLSIVADSWIVEKLLEWSRGLFLLPLAALNGLLTFMGITDAIDQRVSKQLAQEDS